MPLTFASQLNPCSLSVLSHSTRIIFRQILLNISPESKWISGRRVWKCFGAGKQTNCCECKKSTNPKVHISFCSHFYGWKSELLAFLFCHMCSRFFCCFIFNEHLFLFVSIMFTIEAHTISKHIERMHTNIIAFAMAFSVSTLISCFFPPSVWCAFCWSILHSLLHDHFTYCWRLYCFPCSAQNRCDTIQLNHMFDALRTKKANKIHLQFGKSMINAENKTGKKMRARFIKKRWQPMTSLFSLSLWAFCLCRTHDANYKLLQPIRIEFDGFK